MHQCRGNGHEKIAYRWRGNVPKLGYTMDESYSTMCPGRVRRDSDAGLRFLDETGGMWPADRKKPVEQARQGLAWLNLVMSENWEKDQNVEAEAEIHVSEIRAKVTI